MRVLQINWHRTVAEHVGQMPWSHIDLAVADTNGFLGSTAAIQTLGRIHTMRISNDFKRTDVAEWNSRFDDLIGVVDDLLMTGFLALVRRLTIISPHFIQCTDVCCHV
jgi:hypothetical protein